MSSFINQNDPTQVLDLSGVDIRSQYSKLSERDKLMVFCKVNGYNRLPPTIETLYSDSYYLGGPEFFDGGSNIYEYWKDKLKMIYPSAVTTSKTMIVLKSAIGTGKSTMSRLMLANTFARMLCMTNPSRTLHLTPKPFSFVAVHRSEEVAIKEFKYWLMHEVLEKSPFFKNTKPNFKFQFLTSGPMGQAGLGSDVLVYILSELNFFPNQERAQNFVSTALGRFTSRFDDNATAQVGNIILDSSPKGNGACTDWFIEQTPPEKLWVCSAAHYEVKPQSYLESQGRTFPVYIGDGKYPEQILTDDYRLAEDQDPDRVIHVPIQLIGEARMDLTKMLQDKCGISTSASDSFFGGSVAHFSECMKERSIIPELIEVDFYDTTDRVIDHIRPALRNVAPGSTIWLGLDLAVASDTCGISGVQFDSWEYVNESKYPKVKGLFSIGLSRKKGQETSLRHVFDLIMALKAEYNIVVSADQAFSKQILQDCEREGIKTNGRISTDNVPCEPALFLKNLIMLEMISIPENKRLLREAYDLRYVPTQKGYKIDHPKKATQNTAIFDINNGKGSKDIWDSLASACYSLKMSVDAGEEDGYSNGVNKQLDLIKSMTGSAEEESALRFQDMMGSIF